jgi:predicted chitinase
MPEPAKEPVEPPAPPTATASVAATGALTETIGKWVAVLASVIAVAQAGTAWIDGHWRTQAEAEKGAQDLKLAALQANSSLAKDFLQLIIAKDTAPAERVRVLDALRSLKDHPLQSWAQQTYELYNANLAELMAAYDRQREVAAQQEGAGRDEASVSAEIAALDVKLKEVKDDPAARDQLQKEILLKYAELGRVRARLGVATVTVTETRAVIARSEQGLIPSPPQAPAAIVNRSETLVTLSQKIDSSFLEHYFPAGARQNIETAAPYLQAALQEFQVTDKRMIAAIIATVAVETPNFETYEEPESAAAKYEGRMGNVAPGDGVKFRGRGYLGLTGRQNYEAMSKRLGLGTRLLDSPGDARTPEVASRTLVAWFLDQHVLQALDANDLGAIRRAVSGSPASQIQRFTQLYQRILSDL